MKLYYIPAACSLAAHIILHELGIHATLIKVDHKTHLTETGRDFYEVNPLGYVPAIELDDGTILREGVAIAQFLGDLKPELGLVPPQGSLERYRLQEWLSFLAGEIHKGFIPLLYASLAGRYVETVRPKLEQRFAWVDAQLERRPYLMGDHFTVADAYLFALVGWGQAQWLTSYYRADIHLDSLHNLRRWYARILVRPAVQKALGREGLLL